MILERTQWFLSCGFGDTSVNLDKDCQANCGDDDVNHLSGGECNTLGWRIESHIDKLLGRSELYKRLQGASLVTSPFGV